MKTVIIVGAGSSRAEAESKNAKKHQRPPLDTDFFSISQIHGLESHRERVRNFVLENFGFDVFSYPRPRMEEVFGLVYTSTSGALIPPGTKAAFESLCRIYLTVVAETTNWISPSRRGPLCRLLHSSLCDGETTIISFNQDILVEKALSVLNNKESPASWFPDTGYEMDFETFSTPTRPSSQIKLFDLSEDYEEESTPTVLKPHGSLNWFTKSTKKGVMPSQLKRDQKIYCTRRLSINTDMTYTQETTTGMGRKTWYTWPIIVPPVLEKGTFLGGALEELWEACRDSLLETDRVIIYGYSFPAADVQSRTFFLRAGAGMAERPVLVTINPDMQAAVNAAEIFSPKSHMLCDSVSAYLKNKDQF